MKKRVNYDKIAANYDQRFTSDQSEGVGGALLALARTLSAGRILEVGCGTGHWLAQMYRGAGELYGLDLSAGMLSQARNRNVQAALIRGCAKQLPFESGFFDFAFCVNAIHHFEDPWTFISETFRVLQPGGALAVVGSQPYGRKDSWFAYHYFDGLYKTDLKRFPRWQSVAEWMAASGFERMELNEVERILDPKYSREVLNDPFLQKNSCSQLALLTDEAYAAGLHHLETALAQAEARGETIVFQADISLAMLSGYKAINLPGFSGDGGPFESNCAASPIRAWLLR